MAASETSRAGRPTAACGASRWTERLTARPSLGVGEAGDLVEVVAGVDPGQLLAEQRVLVRAGPDGELVELFPRSADVAAAVTGLALEAQYGQGDGPAAADLAHDGVVVEDHVVQVHLAEGRAAGQLTDRPNVDARCVEGEQEGGDAGVLDDVPGRSARAGARTGRSALRELQIF